MADAVQPQHRHGVRRAAEGEPRGAPRRVPRSRRGGRAAAADLEQLADEAALGDVRGVRVGAVPRAARAGGSTTSRVERGVQPARRDVRARGRRGSRRRASAPTSPTTTSTRSATCSPTSSVALGLSDAGAHVDQLCDAPLPTDLLGTWVRERERDAARAGGAQAHRRAGRHVRLRAAAATCARATGPTCACSTRQTVGTGPDAARARLPGRRRAPDRRGADRRAPRAGQRHADPVDGVQLAGTDRRPGTRPETV